MLNRCKSLQRLFSERYAIYGFDSRTHPSCCVLASHGLRTSSSGQSCADHTPVHKILPSITDISIRMTRVTALCSPCSTLASPALDHPSHETSVLPSLNPEGRSVEHYVKRCTSSAMCPQASISSSSKDQCPCETHPPLNVTQAVVAHIATLYDLCLIQFTRSSHTSQLRYRSYQLSALDPDRMRGPADSRIGDTLRLAVCASA